MTKVVLMSGDEDISDLVQPILRAAPELDVVMHGEQSASDAEIAVCWNPPVGALASLPKLRLVHSIAAGVDGILSDCAFPSVPLCRVVDPQLARGMSEFVTWGVLHYHRQLDRVLANQPIERWFRHEQGDSSECAVGIMGLGEIGSRVAMDLQRFGFAVRGWARKPRELSGVTTFAGPQEFRHFIQGTDILVCLLPLTHETRWILNATTFEYLRPGAKLIHVGRGEHLVPADLIAALTSGKIGGAIVDVFPNEPLPPKDHMWRAPNLIVTPHMASVASWDTIGTQVAANARRLIRGEPLQNVVDVTLCY
ncbi:glyoxylate/hydroxypyruvate reductase A [Paraburkholderia sp. RP-4-7]|uniref:Glyoxylate/hydroxypyruvate reductase A n=1 Tax=Paraburkholderia polaris TaxID=2728848 RepID=A0A848IS77_9BURK|nr:glyoxylate/hydroxypyruvate reductase A [Paraburkholderia polaris]NMM04541.1 glyoxylate/hydroxypyruvate reductase A [Paraburkholderia polaris]